MRKKVGGSSIRFESPVTILETASIVGKKEGEGPLSKFFDEILEDELFGEKTWEKAESKLVEETVKLLLKKSGLKPEDIDYALAGDLLNQTTSSTFGFRDFDIPYFGIYGACSNFGQAMGLGSILIDGGFAEKVIVSASSHFCSAEKQFRTPLEMGGQRPPTSTWTVTGDGSALLSKQGSGPYITEITTGKIIDMGIKDQNNMGAAMAPSAVETLYNHFEDFKRSPDYYDLIITGDLGYVGIELVKDLMNEKGYDVTKNLADCGIEIFDAEKQDTHCGGSGCACSAVTFSGYLFEQLKQKKFNKILFLPTGALLSPLTVLQKESIPGITHAVVIEN